MLDTLIDNFFNPVVAQRYWPTIVEGMVVTIELGVLVVLCGLSVGLLLALLRALQFRLLSWLIIAFADLFRTLPVLVTLILIYFALPFLGCELGGFAATFYTLMFTLAAFAEETFWAGIIAIPRGQWEAARSTGLSYVETLVRVILPQTFRLVIPSLTNRTIAITKMTAIASVVSVEEILANATTAQGYSANTTPLTMAAVAYLIIFLPLVLLSRKLERGRVWKN